MHSIPGHNLVIWVESDVPHGVPMEDLSGEQQAARLLELNLSGGLVPVLNYMGFATHTAHANVVSQGPAATVWHKPSVDYGFTVFVPPDVSFLNKEHLREQIDRIVLATNIRNRHLLRGVKPTHNVRFGIGRRRFRTRRPYRQPHLEQGGSMTDYQLDVQTRGGLIYGPNGGIVPVNLPDVAGLRDSLPWLIAEAFFQNGFHVTTDDVRIQDLNPTLEPRGTEYEVSIFETWWLPEHRKGQVLNTLQKLIDSFLQDFMGLGEVIRCEAGFEPELSQGMDDTRPPVVTAS
jgi:hypothetical protein